MAYMGKCDSFHESLVQEAGLGDFYDPLMDAVCMPVSVLSDGYYMEKISKLLSMDFDSEYEEKFAMSIIPGGLDEVGDPCDYIMQVCIKVVKFMDV